jgi:16S rRNA (guanine966-N2)-methyltransferase
MRISGGLARGLQLKAPAGLLTRPATDQMREAVFSSLGKIVEGAEVADWFAGTGAYGLEALSRGAAHCTFYEIEPQAIGCLKVNLQKITRNLAQTEQAIAKIIRRDLLAPAVLTTERLCTASIVFVDPPYEQLDCHWQTILDHIDETCIRRDGIVVFEVPGNWDKPPIGWEIIKRLGKRHRGKPNALLLKKG